jgi:phage anti-repressor protein
MSDIEKYNNNLVNSKTIITIINYVKAVNRLKYNIDIDFIDEFIELVNKDECCIHHSMLQKYGILSLNKGTTHVKDMITQYNFIENDDFRLSKVRESASKGGCTHKNEYYFHPRAFKICLMRSLKTQKYAKYYLLLEECIKYFNEYQIETNKQYTIHLKEKIKEKDTNIDQLLLISQIFYTFYKNLTI